MSSFRHRPTYSAALRWLRSHPLAFTGLTFGVWILALVLWLLWSDAAHETKGFVARMQLFMSIGLVQASFAFWGVAATFLTYLVSLPEAALDFQHRVLRDSQKERIRILDGFEPTQGKRVFRDDRSVYNATISLLSRLKQNIPELENSGKRHDICMLLCNPALDYFRPEYDSPETIRKRWGQEFLDFVIQDIGPKKQLFNLDICHLPLGSHSGINAMDDFLAVLANYLCSDSAKFEETLGALKSRTEDVIRLNFQTWINQNDGHIVVRDHNIHIPFQIVLINGEKLKEVVVSFAGREILERSHSAEALSVASHRSDPGLSGSEIRGFYSNDPYVVETFHRVYLDYALPSRRAPFIPRHTREVMKKHCGEGHALQDFYGGLVPNLFVGPSSYSPGIANSTKFTTWLLEKVLSDDVKKGFYRKKVLDVGSGTGVLALAAYHLLRGRLGSPDSEVTALEPNENSFRDLNANTNKLPGFLALQWKICHEVDPSRNVVAAWIEDSQGNRITADSRLKQFDLVIGDLPFLDAHDGKNPDLRFLDPHHAAQQALFHFAMMPGLLAKNAYLITAFSSLGGPEDISSFEGHIRRSGLQIVQRVDFFEDNYMWMVYLIMKCSDYREDSSDFWWNRLGVGRASVVLRN